MRGERRGARGERRLIAVVVVCIGVAASAPLSAQTRPSPLAPAVQAGVTISRDTVTVGEPFEVRIRVRASADAEIRFPETPDSSGTVQALDPRTLVTTDSVQSLDQTAIYRLAAWDVGSQPVTIGNVTVVSDGAAEGGRPVTLAAMRVFVRRVLPADSALHVPKPARALWEVKAFPWWLVALIAAAVALGLLFWWWWRRRRRPAPAVVVDPYDRAKREFHRIEAMGLVDAGERTRFAALVVEVLRDYLAARYPEATLSLTSRELINAVRRQAAVPHERVARVLHEADLAKFAAWALSEERARNLARDAKAIVEHEHKASRPVTPSGQERAA